ncbi:bifunctional riboflavin kinase/FAD synthetase [Curvivirga aplysinae]|uniref:bifunctional riboflavin kinase/FAD synthetase n=1 Tax=Curvivirga aplysinae TaxID=2529852 RepID=UPI0012BD2FEC|nr:bifunctional riboflavin kinase/FAD synthetase [Curvivirga aplysinae]MTI11080.1 bifunctional riboflavin kinase/FAD synthetase [Curvivirga aplysinae]
MKLFRHYDTTPPDHQGGVVVLGNFDGVHRGHQAVIGMAAALARDLDAPLQVMSFEPHPRQYFKPDQDPFRLTPMRNKVHHIEALNVDSLFVLNFDENFSELTAEEFLQQVIVDGLKAKHVVVGYDFCFGKGRVGNADMMTAFGKEKGGFGVTAVDPQSSADDEVYSSTIIRDYLREGQPGWAAAILGRPFEIEAHVNKGAQLGRTIGFPTANLSLGEYIRPKYGVYAVRLGVEVDGDVEWFDGVANLGKRPTVDGLTELLEVHVFDFDRDLYGKAVRVALIEFIRAEQKFNGVDELKAQIAIDSETARRILLTRAAGA